MSVPRSTANDLARFAMALEGGTLLAPALVREMMRSHLTAEMMSNTLAGVELPPGYHPPGMGLGWAHFRGRGRSRVPRRQPARGHGHAVPTPRRNRTVVIMTNVSGIGDALTKLAKALSEAAGTGWPEYGPDGAGGG